MREYLTSGWIENIDPKSVEEITINGFPAATAIAKGDQWDVPAVRGAVRQRRLPLHLRDQADDARTSTAPFAKSVGTFRRMTVAESQAAKPLRIRVVTVGRRRHGRAARQPHGDADRQVERFRILNGLGPDRAPARRRQVKIVVGVTDRRAIAPRHSPRPAA